MVVLDGALRVAKDRVLILDYTIRWQTTLRFADRHGAAGGVKAEAHLRRRRDLIVDTGAVGPDVAMIARRRTAGQDEFSDGRSGTDGDGFGCEARPDRIMDVQPGKQIGILCLWEIACECLVKVVMRIHQAGKENHVPRVDHLIRLLRELIRRPDLLNHIPLYIDATICPTSVGIIHRHDECSMLNEQ